MKLIERAEFLSSLHDLFSIASEGEGHCVLVSGESGIGKTSLIKTFSQEIKNSGRILQGTCDALFTPRPLAPLYDIALQIGDAVLKDILNAQDRTELFAIFLQALEKQTGTTLIVIEDVHWADEATLDFIKFLARRITRLSCLFILTYRDNEIHAQHPLRNVLGQLPPDSFTRLQLTPLSKIAVNELATGKGYSGEDIYRITGGNPFYVNEILANYSYGIPDTIKDSILSVYNHLNERTKRVWNLMAILPTGFEIKYLQKIDPSFLESIQNCIQLRIIVSENETLYFKHELYRRTIESSLSPFQRINLNKVILDSLNESFEKNGEIERIVHHAKNANEYDVVVKYAPMAAKKASSLGAHIEASKLYYTAIEFYQGHDADMLIQLYEPYMYECYLTGQIREAIIYAERLLHLLKEKNDLERTGYCMRFLSRLWWFDGNKKHAEMYAHQAIELFINQPASKAKAMAMSTMAQLEMLSDQFEEGLLWGDKAITMAKEVQDEEVLCHALTTVGTIMVKTLSSKEEGIKLMEQSLGIALQNCYQEHAGRAYINLASSAVIVKDYHYARTIVETGLLYCEERDLNVWAQFLQAVKSILYLNMGGWKEAAHFANCLISNEYQVHMGKIDALSVVAKINMRVGSQDVLPLLQEAKALALGIMELGSLFPVLVSFLEYEWITGKRIIENTLLDKFISMLEQRGNMFQAGEFAFWLCKARNQSLNVADVFEGYQVDTSKKARKAAEIWKQLGCPYEQALALFEGDEDDKRKALEIMDKLGANAVFEKMKFLMRAVGIRSLPKGIRKTTRANPANLTERELDVLQLMKEGLQNKEIADRLFVSPKTIDHHISSIFYKLEVNSRTKAVQEAQQMNILQ
jgi:predicted ATPase/DNA-binding CsgD family transcriptional regulator